MNRGGNPGSNPNVGNVDRGRINSGGSSSGGSIGGGSIGSGNRNLGGGIERPRDGGGGSQNRDGDSGRIIGGRDSGGSSNRGSQDGGRGIGSRDGDGNNSFVMPDGRTRINNYNYRQGRDVTGPVKIGRAPATKIRGDRATVYYHGVPSYHYGYLTFGSPSFSIRIGYTHYDYRWRDDYFFFRHYVYDPCLYPSYVSPWYYYPHLPAYVVANRVRIYQPLPFFTGTVYHWGRPSIQRDWDRPVTDLDYAVDDIITAFENNNRRSKNRLIPSDGAVAIRIDGEYSYSLTPDDFEEMFSDAIESTRTVRYEIVDVRYNSREAQVLARHFFEDPWGARQSVWHTYRLQAERGGAVIREFGVSETRPFN